MCVKIIRTKETVEFDPAQPLELQAKGAKQVIVDYKHEDSQIVSFMEQFERIAKSGMGFQMNIKFNSNHTLEGYRVDRKIESLHKDLELNDIINQMVALTAHAEKQLFELVGMCERK